MLKGNLQKKKKKPEKSRASLINEENREMVPVLCLLSAFQELKHDMMQRADGNIYAVIFC